MRRLAIPILLAAYAMLMVVLVSSVHASAPDPSDGQCTTGKSPRGHVLVRCLNKTYHCKGEAHGLQINVKIDSPATKLDGVHLDDGCTGSLRVRIETNSGDGVKVHNGAHDLTVYMGKPGTGKPGQGSKVGIKCTGKSGAVHQDGVQAMGGDHVTFDSPNVDCPTGNNGGLFVNGGAGGRGTPTAIVFVGGFSYEGNASIHIGDASDSSGARGVIMKTNRTKASPPNCIRIGKNAKNPVNENNTCTTPKP